MPLYLVRWPGLRASLVRARSEAELLDTLDEVASPGECTWQVYRGPLWIDFQVPVRYQTDPRLPGRLIPEEVTIEDLSLLKDRDLEPNWPEFCETAFETRSAIMRGAFPKLAAALDGDDDDGPASTDLGAAVVGDLVGHAAAIAHRGVTFDEDMRLIVTQTRCFQRVARGRFTEVDPTFFDDFCLGLERLRPARDGLVRVAMVSVSLRNARPVSARVSLALMLRANSEGVIDPLHRLDAYVDAAPDGALRQFEARRNEAVAWRIDASDRTALARIVNELVGRDVFDRTE